MTTDQIIQTLNSFTPFSDDDVENDNERFLANLTDELRIKPDFERAINPIFLLIEKYPNADFGNPGPLVHTLESKIGLYEDALQQSLSRKPTRLTAWMLNRIINAEKNIIIKENLLSRLTALLNHPLIDAETKEFVQGFIDYQNKSDER
jgi:hypothetical protein